MRLLILTQYYPPETGAAQNRLHALARRLAFLGMDVSVLTAMPNYPQMKVAKGYRNRFYKYDHADGIKVMRSWIFVKNSRSIFLRLLNYFSFVFSSMLVGLFKLRRTDYIFCESPPLFLGITAYLLARFKGAKLIFNVSDLWPESAEKLGLIRSKTLLGMSTRLEEFLYRKSVLVSGQTRGIVDNIQIRFPDKNVHWLPNGAELDFFQPDTDSGKWRRENGFSSQDLLAFYGGIFGHAQGLEVILRAAGELAEDSRLKFILMGSGPRKEELLEMHRQMKPGNVFFFDNVPKHKMPEVLAAIDFTIIPLKRIELFKGAIPSKIFESLAMKKPLVLGVEGEAWQLFIDEGKCGLGFIPEDHHDLAEKIRIMTGAENDRKEMGENARHYVEQHFDRNQIADRFYETIVRIHRKQ